MFPGATLGVFMQLKVKRSQRQGGVMGNKLLFCLDARVEFNGEERANISKYKLGSMCIYNSEAAKKHVVAAAGHMATGSVVGSLKAIGSYAMAAINLNITIDDLERGKHVECKDMDELLGAEDAVITACENLKTYLNTAATFDGREVLIDFSNEEPKVAAPGPASLAPPPAAPAQLAAPMIQNAMSSSEPIPAQSPAPAMSMAMATGPMSPDRSFNDEPPPIDKFQEWWGGLTGQQKGFTIGGALLAFYILIKLF